MSVTVSSILHDSVRRAHTELDRLVSCVDGAAAATGVAVAHATWVPVVESKKTRKEPPAPAVDAHERIDVFDLVQRATTIEPEATPPKQPEPSMDESVTQEAAPPTKEAVAQEAATPTKEAVAQEAAAPTKEAVAQEAAAPTKEAVAQEAAAPTKKKRQRKSSHIELGDDDSESDGEPKLTLVEEERQLRREFSDFLADDEDDVADDAPPDSAEFVENVGTAPAFGRAIRAAEKALQKRRKVDDKDDALETMVQIEAFDAVTHGKTFDAASGKYRDDESGAAKQAYSRYLERLQAYVDDPTYTAARRCYERLESLVDEASEKSDEWARLATAMRSSLNWHVEHPSTSSSRSIVHVYRSANYGGRPTLDGLEHTESVEVSRSTATNDELLRAVWRATNWSLWMRSLFLMHRRAWTGAANLQEVLIALSDPSIEPSRTLLASYKETVEYVRQHIDAADGATV